MEPAGRTEKRQALANKLIIAKDSAWIITDFNQKRAQVCCFTHCGENEDNSGFRGVFEGLSEVQVSNYSQAFCPVHCFLLLLFFFLYFQGKSIRLAAC